MGPASVIAGDWGTSHLRLFLCDPDGAVLERRDGPGAAESRNRFDTVFDSLTANWEPVPALLCGMVGSNFGWVEAPYVSCPARAEQIASKATCIRDRQVHIAPGLRCRNRFGAPDVMRGEETQILGVLNEVGAGLNLLCLPGTHTKWVLIEDGAVREFFTAVSGEIFALLKRHSVLVPEGQANDEAFSEGLAQVTRFPNAQWLHRAFESRSRRLTGELSDDAAASFLSGLTIGSDVGGALQLLTGVRHEATVHVIGEPQLSALYAKALTCYGRKTQIHDGEAASLAGLLQLKRLLHV
jgi:2-dehydro-3-deoxygalactonokinase